MRIPDVHRALVRRSQSPRTLDLFAEARARHAALDAFQSPTKVVEFLRRNEGRCVQQRSDVVAALIAEVQSGNTADWLALLVLAFFPGLLRLRGRLAPAVFASSSELTALTFECFCEAAVALPLPTQSRCAVVNVMSATRRRLFRVLRSEEERARLEHPTPAATLELAAVNALVNDAAREAARAHEPLDPDVVLAQLVASGGCACDSDLALLVEAHEAGISLATWVRRAHPSLEESEFQRTYERLRRRRSRLAARARDLSQRDAAMPLSRAREANTSSTPVLGA